MFTVFELMCSGLKGVKEEEKQQEVEISANRNEPSEAPPPQAEPKASVASLPLPPYDPSNPIGEFNQFTGTLSTIGNRVGPD